MCERQKVTFINDNVRGCCQNGFVTRRPCFTALGADKKYVIPPFDAANFHFTKELCEGSIEHQQNNRLM